MTDYAYETWDVFTDERFGGNPLAVVLDATDLSDAQMQAIAAEFNYSETIFIRPPADPANTALVRIFTPRSELPFAGHPNIGAAVALAQSGRDRNGRLRFEQAAGVVALSVIRTARGEAVAARLEAPQPLRIGASVDGARVVAAASLTVSDLCTQSHAPVIAGAGVAFVVAEVCDAALSEARPAPTTPPLNLCLYALTSPKTARVRVFAPGEGIAEDPATGSAAVALAALIVETRDLPSVELSITQGTEINRPSRLEAAALRDGDAIRAAVAGACVRVMRGTLSL